MRHFIAFIIVVFVGLFVALLNRSTDIKPIDGQKVTLRVFGYSSFTGKWGPGPKLKALFEKECNCIVEFIEVADSGYLLQRLKIEGQSLGADLLIGIDQYDLQKALSDHSWKKFDLANFDVDPVVKTFLNHEEFIPFDWGVLTFIVRKGELAKVPASLDDLLSPDLNKKISLQDPRTSSPGLQFLSWVMMSKGEEAGKEFLQKLNSQVHSYSPSWSTAYGLFTNKTTATSFSYTTSPIYHEVEEKNSNYMALEFKEGHPIQVEFMAIPDICKNCDLAEKFVNFMLANEGQRIIMERNYMFPVIRGVKEGTPFSKVPAFKLIERPQLPTAEDIDRWLRMWVELRRGDG